MRANPFQILGFNQDVLRGLVDEDIGTLLKAQYRTLALVHHPDRGGSEDKYRRILRAWEEINPESNPGGFRYWKSYFMKSRKEQLLLAEEDVEQARQVAAIAEARLVAFLTVYAQRNNEKILTAFNFRSVRLLVTDTIDALQRGLSLMDMEKLSPKGFDLEVDSKGRLFRFEVTHVAVRKREEIPSSMHPHWFETKRFHDFFHYWKRTGEKHEVRGVQLIGQISSLRAEKSFLGVAQHHELNRNPTEENAAGGTPGYSWNTFRAYFANFSPLIRRGRYLVGMGTGKDPTFFVFGSIRGIHFLGSREVATPPL